MCALAGVPFREVQIAACHADPRATTVYDHHRQNLDKHAAYVVVAFVAGAGGLPLAERAHDAHRRRYRAVRHLWATRRTASSPRYRVVDALHCAGYTGLWRSAAKVETMDTDALTRTARSGGR